MIVARNRLSKDEVKIVFEKGRRYGGASGAIIFLKDSKRKYAVVVPKKLLNSAVKRNSLRRKIYTFLRQRMPSILPGHLVILPNQKVTTLDFRGISHELHTLLFNARLLSPDAKMI
ncbi:MAG TPA: ribonuclease P protein component [Candidatus Paceibacterota bacterium]|nr:ribonuclease P protein component [Candidatus Paceibacterota bacterium]